MPRARIAFTVVASVSVRGTTLARVGRGLLVLAVVCAAAAPPTSASSWTAPVAPPIAGPVLLGGTAAYAIATRDGGAIVRGQDGPGSVRELVRLPPQEGLAVSLAGSDQLLAVHPFAAVCTQIVGCYPGDPPVQVDSILAGPPGASLDCIADFVQDGSCHADPCAGTVTTRRANVPAVFGSEVAFCSGQGTTVRDLAADAAITQGTAPVSWPRLAGTWVAGSWINDEGIEVVDWRTGQTGLSLPGSYGHVVGLDTDGTVFYTASKPRSSQAALFWASPSDPQPHPIPIALSYSSQLHAADGLIARRETRDGAPATGQPARIDVFDLSGRPVLSDDEPAAVGTWDFDGHRLAYLSRPCAVTTLVVRELGDAAPARPEGDCAAARPRRIATLRGRLFTVALDCPAGARLGCFGFLRVVASVARVLRPRTAIVVGDARFALTPGAGSSRTFTLGTPARRWLGRHRGAKLTAISVATDSPTATGAPQVRRQHLEVRR